MDIVPCVNKCPKLVIGTNAPPPNINTYLSYILNISRNAPTTTNILVICPGVSLVLSNINCPIKHIKPAKINELKYIIINLQTNSVTNTWNR